MGEIRRDDKTRLITPLLLAVKMLALKNVFQYLFCLIFEHILISLAERGNITEEYLLFYKERDRKETVLKGYKWMKRGG